MLAIRRDRIDGLLARHGRYTAATPPSSSPPPVKILRWCQNYAAAGQRSAVSGGTVAAVEVRAGGVFMGRTARERLARLLDEAEAPGSFSAQILAPADALRVEVVWRRGREHSRARAAGEEADRGGAAGEVRAGGADADRHQRA